MEMGVFATSSSKENIVIVTINLLFVMRLPACSFAIEVEETLYFSLHSLFCIVLLAERDEKRGTPLVAGTLRGLLRFAKHIFSTQIQELRGYSLALSHLHVTYCLPCF
jgi:hypothetical protein